MSLGLLNRQLNKTMVVLQALRIAEKMCLLEPLPASPVKMFMRNKHYTPKWKKHRAAKVIKIDLPDFDKMRRDNALSIEERRAQSLRDNELPPRVFKERDFHLSTSGAIVDPYVPPEGDAVASLVSLEGSKQKLIQAKHKGIQMKHIRKIRQFDENFNVKSFAQEGFEIYKQVYELLQDVKQNEERLHDLITEFAWPNIVLGLELKTFQWNFFESLELPRVVHARAESALTEDNVYGQVTVRFFTKQTLAMFDRFGRLIFGSPTMITDCLEYVVFEKHLSDSNSAWRLHGKVMPTWQEQKDQIIPTTVVEKAEKLQWPPYTTKNEEIIPKSQTIAHVSWPPKDIFNRRSYKQKILLEKLKKPLVETESKHDAGTPTAS